MSYNPPVKNTALIMYVALQSLSSAGSFLSSPPVGAGMLKISQMDGALANATNDPVVSPAGSIWVKLSFTAAEMNTDVLKIQLIDTAGAKRFADCVLSIPTA